MSVTRSPRAVLRRHAQTSLAQFAARARGLPRPMASDAFGSTLVALTRGGTAIDAGWAFLPAADVRHRAVARAILPRDGEYVLAMLIDRSDPDSPRMVVPRQSQFEEPRYVRPHELAQLVPLCCPDAKDRLVTIVDVGPSPPDGHAYDPFAAEFALHSGQSVRVPAGAVGTLVDTTRKGDDVGPGLWPTIYDPTLRDSARHARWALRSAGDPMPQVTHYRAQRPTHR